MEKGNIPVESPLTSYLMSKAGRERIPLNGTFELSPVCNFACKMCYVRKTQKEVDRHPRPMLTAEKWLEIARQARNQGLLYLLLTGGEPFLYPRFWELYKKLSEMGFLISINTNGSMITDEAITRLREMPPVRINITLYGASDRTYQSLCGITGAFDRVDHAITGLTDAGISVKLNCSLTPHNVQDLKEMVQYAETRNLILDTTAYMFPPLRRAPDLIGTNDRFTPREAAAYTIEAYRLLHKKEDYRRYLELLLSGICEPPGLDESCIDPADGKIRCRAGKAAFWITWDGYMTPCGVMPEPKTDLCCQDFSHAWQETVRKAEALALSGVCRSCSNRSVCHSCAAMALTETGSVSGIPRYLCEMVTEMKIIAAEELKSMKNSITQTL